MARTFLTPFGSFRSDPFLSLHRDVNRLFDDVLRGGSNPASSDQNSNIIPAQVNVAETPEVFRITAELPGVTRDQVDVRLEDDVLTIRGEKRFERRDDKEDYHLVECSYGTVQRSLRLPYPVDPEQVQASFENGLLLITLPKSKAQDRSRRIEVRAAEAQGQLENQDRSSTSNGHDETERGQRSSNDSGPADARPAP